MIAAAFAVLGALAGPAAVAAQAETPADAGAAIDLLIDRVEVAYQRRDPAALDEARAALGELSGTSTSQTDRVAYLSAYVSFRQALLAEGASGTAIRHLDACIAELDGLLARQPGDAQARALLGSCHGLSTRHQRSSLVSRGLAARRHIAAARELAPADPWVVMQDGLADFATPRLFGGDRREAMRKLERATALFEAALSAGSRRAAWGAYEAWQQLAQMREAEGLKAAAQAAMLRAQALAPRLMPSARLLAAAN